MPYTTETGTYVLRDSDGYVVAKADVPPGEHEVGDPVDPSMCVEITADTDLSAALSESPANLPSDVPNDPASTAREKLENVAIDDKYKP